jgi:hypothetical protein
VFPRIPPRWRSSIFFVTSTDVDGHVYTQFDDAGRPINVKDHRAVFQLSHRAGRKTPFAATPQGDDAKSRVIFEALAKLSRATSCFPAAFAPVYVKETSTGDTSSADGGPELIEGGQLWGGPWR